MERLLKKKWIRLLPPIFLIIVIFIVLRLLNVDFSNISEEKFKAWVESFGAWGIIIYILIYVFRPLIFFPAGVLSAVAGIIWGPIIGFLYLQIAANISSTIEFLTARYFAEDLIAKYLEKKMSFLDERIKEHGFLTVLLVRLIPNVAWDIQNFSLGLTKVRFKDYFFATLIGIMPGSFAFVFFGASLIKVLFNPKNFWIIIVAILLFVAIFFLQRYLRRKHRM
jgi:uncharacterized membrane protein YdjX (TVP38/TMEM64 family)